MNIKFIGKIMQKFEEIGSLGERVSRVQHRGMRSAENIAIVRDSLAKDMEDLHLHPYKIQLTQK